MCGIAGYLSSRADIEFSTALKEMATAVAHRGPDDAGYFEVPFSEKYRLGLAHRRLSIIDLSTGHQPLGNEDGSIQIVFNGEVYNFQELRQVLEAAGHRFATHSDTETIVHAYEEWGDHCVKRFRGMFAFALWDGRRKRLLLARDRFGKKPLFIRDAGGLLLFASEIKAILAFPGVTSRPDIDAIWDYLTYRYVPAPATLCQGIRKVMPGAYAIWENGKLEETRYWSPPDREPRAPAALPADPTGTFMEKLEESVRIRMVSDVPFGAFLSGGIDSSAVVALMSRHSSLPVKTFSVGFTEGGYSELEYARVIAEKFHTQHHELVIGADQLMQHLPALVRYRDAPVAEPSDIPIFLLSLEARNTVKMVLTGEGSDEILGGYPKHVFERLTSGYQRLPRFFIRGIIEPLVRALPYGFRRAKTAVVNMGLENFEERMQRWFGALSYAERQGLVQLVPPRRKNGEYQFDTPSFNSALRKILYFDQTSWLPDNLLERGDRMTMAASLEGRMPFMDHELAAFVSSLPDQYRVRGRTTKWLLRDGMRRIIPQSILERPKVGFRVPVNVWFRSTMREYLYDHLLGPDSRTTNYFRRGVLEGIVGEHIGGRQNHEKLLWCLLGLEIWHRENGICG